jgi:hypothetical protein
VFHFHVEHGVVMRFVVERANVPRNSALTLGVDHRGRAVGLHLPADQVREEAVGFGQVAAADLKMHDGMCGRLTPGGHHGGRLASEPHDGYTDLQVECVPSYFLRKSYEHLHSRQIVRLIGV